MMIEPRLQLRVISCCLKCSVIWSIERTLGRICVVIIKILSTVHLGVLMEKETCVPWQVDSEECYVF